jgi:acetyl esterase/lipase
MHCMKQKFLLGVMLMVGIHFSYGQKVIQLYDGAAPGSADWNWQEKEYFSTMINTEVVYNVVHPSMTVYLPDSGLAYGTAVIICPGGGFRFLSINSEGNDVAKWLTKKGVTCFVLKYRIVHVTTDNPVQAMFSGLNDPKKFDEENLKLLPLAIADTRAAIAYLRSHADQWGLLKNKIGILGFSAGGTMAESSAFGYTPDDRPDFVAPIYAYVPAGQNTEVAKDAPPMFLAAASDDQLHLVPSSLTLYSAWQAASKSVELHLYAKGGHGFGMRIQHLSSDTWIDRFGEWLGQQGFLKK